eukprot:TRINITY_DN91191_c0_g1_i1.p1 TRINITY_DN91191_c0_g1~~TRINITY_DN91191_c0_g1_i1.p1  ORF type:complete len:898 (+),score=205.49 TRINITY_DN91191_c0_g1_i1:109-2802(+)
MWRVATLVAAVLLWPSCQAAQVGRQTHRSSKRSSAHSRLRGGAAHQSHRHLAQHGHTQMVARTTHKEHSTHTVRKQHGHHASSKRKLRSHSSRHKRSHQSHKSSQHRRLHANRTSFLQAKREVAMRAQVRARISLEEALSNLPPKVVDLFTQFKKAPDATKGAATLEQLNKVYKHAQHVQDEVGFTCAEKNATLNIESESAQDDLEQVTSQLVQVQDRLHSLQNGMLRSQTEIETLRAQFAEHRQLCGTNTLTYKQALANLTADIPLAEELFTDVTAGCSTGGEPAAMVDCSMPDGTIVSTFTADARRKKVAQLTGQSERLLAENIEEALKTTALDQEVPPEEVLALVAVKSQRRTVHTTVAESTITVAGQEIPAHFCTAARKPSCANFVDSMEAFVGSVRDAVDDLNARQSAEEDHCRDSLQSYTQLIRDLKDEVGNVGVAMANGVSEQASLVALRRQRETQFAELSKEAREKLGDCGDRLRDAAGTMCGAKKLWKQLKKKVSDGKFLGACEVSDWVAGPCSAECGVGGTQNVTRQIVSPGLEEKDCPPLALTKVCNQKPCPIDAEMGRWEEWSQCSRVCGGGTRTRRRMVLRESQNGGTPTAETLQEELCSPQPCDSDCELGSWTAWSNCSTACGQGHQLRSRPVLQDAVGRGSCPAADTDERRQTVQCDDKASTCNSTTFKCASPADVLLVLDGSGSVSSAGFDKLKAFATKLLERVTLSGEDQADATKLMLRTAKEAGQARMGAIAFGGEAATIVSDLTEKRSDLSGALGSLKWPGAEAKGWGTNTAQALAVARQLFQRQNDNPGAEQVAVVISNGAPTSGRLVTTEVERLKDAGVRMVFLEVGLGVGHHAAKQWASWPHSENIVKAWTYTALDDAAKVSELLVKICPVLVEQ